MNCNTNSFIFSHSCNNLPLIQPSHSFFPYNLMDHGKLFHGFWHWWQLPCFRIVSQNFSSGAHQNDTKRAKLMKKNISTSKKTTQHPFAGQNMHQLLCHNAQLLWTLGSSLIMKMSKNIDTKPKLVKVFFWAFKEDVIYLFQKKIFV